MLSLLLPLLLGLQGVPQPRRSSLVVFPEQSARSIPWPDSLPALEAGRMVAGDVTGDLLADAVLLAGGQPVVVYGPAVYRAVFALPFQANDLAVLPPGGAGEAGELVLVGPAGLQRLTAYAAGQFQASPAGSTQWLDARRVLAADVDRDGASDLVGLSAQDELLILAGLDAPAPLETVLALGETVLDLAAIDWLGDGSDLALAVLTPAGLAVRATSGALLFALSGATEGGELAVLREEGVPFERLAVLHAASGLQSLLVLDRLAVEAPIQLGSPGAFGLASADADLEGRSDLLLLQHLSHDSVLFRNRGGRPCADETFGLGAKDVELVGLAPHATPLPAWAAHPVLTDFTRDGDADLVALVEASDELVHVENATRGHERLEVSVLGGVYVFDEAQELGELRLHLAAPAALKFAPSHVEVVGWKQADAATNATAEPTAAVHIFSALDGTLETHPQVFLSEPELSTPNVYHFVLRAVRLAGASVVAAGPSAVHAFTTPESLVAELEAQFGAGQELRVFVVEDGVERELTAQELADRLLAPKTVKAFQVPLIEFPPNPFE
jgi:hypothetical protein